MLTELYLALASSLLLLVEMASDSKTVKKEQAVVPATDGAASSGKSKAVVVTCTPCAAPGCTGFRQKGQKWCVDHKRAYAAMHAQAKKQGSTQLATFQEVMADETRSQLAMRDWCNQNPIGERWARKRLIDFAQYSKVSGHHAYAGSYDADVPMTEPEFLHWAQSEKRMTPTGAGAWWAEILQSEAPRDMQGRDAHGQVGVLRLWIPREERRERKRGRFEDRSLSQSSKQLKNMGRDDLNELSVFMQGQSVDEAFLRGESSAGSSSALVLPLESTPAAPSASATEPLPLEPMSHATAPALPPAAAGAIVDVAMAKPKIVQKLTSELGTCKKSLEAVAKKAFEAWQTVPDEKDQARREGPQWQ